MSRPRTLRAIILIVALLPATCALASDEEARAARLLREALSVVDSEPAPAQRLEWVKDADDFNWFGLYADGKQVGAYSVRTGRYYRIVGARWERDRPPILPPVFRRAPAIISGGC